MKIATRYQIQIKRTKKPHKLTLIEVDELDQAKRLVKFFKQQIISRGKNAKYYFSDIELKNDDVLIVENAYMTKFV